MALSEIQNSRKAQDPVLSAINNIPISETKKTEGVENRPTVSRIDLSEIPEEAKRTTEEKIQRISELMNNYVRSLQRDIKIQVNNETGNIIIKVISEESGKVIREIPPEEMLRLAERIEELAGTFFDQIV